MAETAPIDHAALRHFAADCYRAMGVRDEAADLIADTLVQADLWGHQSHGVMRIFWYAARLKSGAMDGNAIPRIDGGLGALATMDGGGGPGQVVAKAAMEEAITRAKQHGIGAVSVHNSGHFGTAMYFTRMAAQAGCVGFLSTNASPAMAPWGGAEKRVGNNPWSWSAPAGSHPPMMLDVANTAVARGKLYLARQRGEAIPETWAMGADGAATTDPAAGIAGTILPMAGHKGYAISTLMDVLSGVLSGSGFGRAIIGPYVPEGVSGVGHLAIAIDIAATRPLPEFQADMDRMIADLKSTPRRPGVDEIFYPGEIEARSDARLRDEGIRLPQDTADELRADARAMGIEAPF
ncbi:Ldh family oxidoreductase [Paracoccus sp. TK19116]|uniref:Ldh family oxidoreductase n=1 Tax=Paracoccus albicereus TaxID=2922394 RepID=A0ABT1MSK8_9RHOB|nr:Ldh family oxidoreductase [Paracoccus albicereus]MCQ0971294.1 Ldh family oxidoreductase [Paracoccus albicereus]